MRFDRLERSIYYVKHLGSPPSRGKIFVRTKKTFWFLVYLPNTVELVNVTHRLNTCFANPQPRSIFSCKQVHGGLASPRTNCDILRSAEYVVVFKRARIPLLLSGGTGRKGKFRDPIISIPSNYTDVPLHFKQPTIVASFHARLLLAPQKIPTLVMPRCR
ncbi:uncharacterized protein BDR25DRAFT_359350 [Lindgomyces ingoldianus]|uniref:Uncharacterized protein n=1 Tax=Lindgomyces ingoldianus TaxID=673940 RepID=A0ACB6QJS9_9PLEO|nr:uncharacterized protein BDR25DRAFT_359350 [Lindgomyces ingoldianus]KAF2466838.1 hypothetical protein BDR25DRAFT_359350 [Lindgomyces ingoldianus]